MDTKSLSYDELASLLGIERESARHLAFRRRWRRTKGNDGKARVDVPLDALPQPNSPTGPSPATITDIPTDSITGSSTGSEVVLTRHIERLEAMLEDAQARLTAAEADRAAARDEARDAQRAREGVEAQIAALNTVLEIERQRAVEERRQADEHFADARRQADERVAAERQHVEEWKAVADRFAAQAEALATRPNGLFALFRRWV